MRPDGIPYSSRPRSKPGILSAILARFSTLFIRRTKLDRPAFVPVLVRRERSRWDTDRYPEILDGEHLN